MAGKRNERLADRIKVLLAQALERRLKDPRLGMLTITDVRLSGDNQHASVFYTVFGDQQTVDASAEALASAKGMLRTHVGQQLGVRHTPDLEFILDAVPESARRIEDLLAQARESDARVAAQAAGADYAGDPDPYKKRPTDTEP